jgi:hypothetical protein
VCGPTHYLTVLTAIPFTPTAPTLFASGHTADYADLAFLCWDGRCTSASNGTTARREQHPALFDTRTEQLVVNCCVFLSVCSQHTILLVGGATAVVHNFLDIIAVPVDVLVVAEFLFLCMCVCVCVCLYVRMYVCSVRVCLWVLGCYLAP